MARGLHSSSTGCPCNSCSLLLYFIGLRRAGVAQLVEHLICNQRVGGSSPFTGSSQVRAGVVEWLMAPGCKPGRLTSYVGSNPSPSTKRNLELRFEVSEAGVAQW